MTKKLCILIISAVFIMSSLVVAGQEANVPQPEAGRSTVAAPELLESPDISSTKTIQDGDISPVTEKLIEQGVIPAAVDKEAQKVVVPSN